MKPNHLDGKIFALALAVVSLGICYGAICDPSTLERTSAAYPAAEGSIDASIASLWDLDASGAFSVSDVGTGDASLLAGDVEVPLSVSAPDLAYHPVYSLGRPVMEAQFLSTVPAGSAETAMDNGASSMGDAALRTASDGEGDAMGGQEIADGTAPAQVQDRTDSVFILPQNADPSASPAGGSSFSPPLTAGYVPTGVQTLSGSFYAPAQAAQAQARIAGTVPGPDQSTAATSVGQPSTPSATVASASLASNPPATAPLIGNLSGTLISEVNPASSDFGSTLAGAFVKTAALTSDVSATGSTVTTAAAPVFDVVTSLPSVNTVTSKVPLAQVPDRGGTWVLLGIGLACIAPFALRRKDSTDTGR